MRVLVLAAHTDDEVLGVGGTIAKHAAAGDDVYVCSVCDRATGHQLDQTVIEQLRAYALAASHILGVKEVFFCGAHDEQLTTIEAVKRIEGHVARISPVVLYTHHRRDSNQDHQALFEASIIVSRTMGRQVIGKVMCYEVPSSTEQAPPFVEYSFLPNVFVNIEHTLEAKLKALAVYKSEVAEFPHPRSLKAVETVARHWGVKAGLQAAEAFELVREIVH